MEVLTVLGSSAGSRWLPYAFVASCVLGTGGCDIVREPTALDAGDGPIAVHAMLVAGERRVAVLVTRYDSGGVYGRNYRLVPVTRAEVRITGAGQTITLGSTDTAEPCVDDHGYTPVDTRVSLAPGCYTALARAAIAPGERYELQIGLPGGATVTGEAEVPRPVTVRVPEQGARIEVRTWYDPDNPAPTHPLAWTPTGPDRAVRLRLEANADDGANETSTCRRAWALQDRENGGLQEPQLFRIPEPGPSDAVMVRAIDLTGRDSVDIRGWYLYCDDPPTGELDGALQLAVFDLAYAQYLDELARSQSLSLAEASVGLRGAVGVFTGTAVTRQPVRLVVRTEQQHERAWR